MNNIHKTKEEALAAMWEQINAGGCDRQARMDASIDKRLANGRKWDELFENRPVKTKGKTDAEKTREAMGYGSGRKTGD